MSVLERSAGFLRQKWIENFEGAEVAEVFIVGDDGEAVFEGEGGEVGVHDLVAGELPVAAEVNPAGAGLAGIELGQESRGASERFSERPSFLRR